MRTSTLVIGVVNVVIGDDLKMTTTPPIYKSIDFYRNCHPLTLAVDSSTGFDTFTKL